MCHSIHYFTIVFNISLFQYVHLVSNVSLSCTFYMLLPFDVGIYNKVGFDVVSLSGWFVVCVIVSVDNERNIEVS